MTPSIVHEAPNELLKVKGRLIVHVVPMENDEVEIDGLDLPNLLCLLPHDDGEDENGYSTEDYGSVELVIRRLEV